MTRSGTGYQTALCNELQKSKIDLAGISEARIPGPGSSRVQGSLLLHSGGAHRQHGVALVISPQLVNSLQSWSPISDRLLQSRFSHKHGHLTVVVVYAPTEIADDDTKDSFYHQFSAAIATVPPHDILVILGDLNAVTGPPTDSSSIVGPFGSGMPNDNTERLLSLCAVHGLTVMGSWFRRRDIHRWTWLSHDGTTKKGD